MIISASYKTDIPAFYGEWFEKRLEAGYCKVANPYNRRQVSRISLRREDMDGFVFWTKNLGPFEKRLETVSEFGRPFTVQYTITAYPRALESSVVVSKRSIQHMKTLAERYGPKAAVWRYDPILFSSLTPVDFHLKNFENLAGALEGTTDEVVISFAQIYRKTLKNLDLAAHKFRFTWEDPPDEAKLDLAADLAKMAKAHGMQLTICSQRRYIVPGAEAARCVDARRLSEIGGRPIRAKIKGKRPDCKCYKSVDIGEYDTCPHGCVYCYAVRNRDLALSRYKKHDPKSEFLFCPGEDGASSQEETKQATLF
ncbi:MAG TPA: DUF1848 domain-containing protein [Methanotrichaceae archaeon]|mgnify:CR=1 FL=1|nr:DUF1848 domain-containing protein [Methanotrichaceae archaeon]